MSDGVTDAPGLNASEFELIRQLASQSFGLDLREGKERLVAVRLGKHVRDGGFRSFRQYYDRVRSDRTGTMLSSLIDALTTNHTAFLREPEHFEFYNNRLQEEYRTRRQVNVWCAASSTGEEPYTLVCSALSHPDAGIPDVRVVASDVSTRALAIAKRGVYDAARIATLPAEWRTKFFEPAQAAPGEVKVKAQVQARVSFQRVNLVESIPPIGPFSMIFCRNVMIYFSKATQTEVVARLAAKLEPGGYLFVGLSESLSGIPHTLKYVRPAVYRKAT
jgi:chemotaxis protein methyltransferase CheR